MLRTNETNVELIIEIDEGTDLTVPISLANELVTELLSTYYTEFRLELIERYLAAHFYTVSNPLAKSEKAGDVGVTYEGVTEMGFNSSKYGQTAMRLDTKGLLAALEDSQRKGKRRKVGISSLATLSISQEQNMDNA